MGDLIRGHTFSGSPATATVTDVHNLVDEATIKPGVVTSDKLADAAVSGSKLADAAVSRSKLAADGHFFYEVGGSTNALTITTGESLSTIPDGAVFVFRPAYTNTSGSVTLQVDGLPAVTISRPGGLKAGDLLGGRIAAVRYNASFAQFDLLSPPVAYDGLLAGFTVGGTADNISLLNASGPPVALTDGLALVFLPTADNTGAAQVTVNLLGPTPIKKNFDEDLAAGDLKAGHPAVLIYDGTNFQLVSAHNLAAVAAETVDYSADSVLFVDDDDAHVKRMLAGSAFQRPLQHALLEHRLAPNTAGGGNTAGEWTPRPLNVITWDPHSLVTLSNNRFTPVAGTYSIRARAAFHKVASARMRVYNVTAGATVVLGMVDRFAIQYSATGVHYECAGVFTANGTDEFEVQYYTSGTDGTYGLGYNAHNDGEDSIYAQVYLTKEA